MKLKTIGKLVYIVSLMSTILIVGISLDCLGWQFWIIGLCVLFANVGGMLTQAGEE